MKTIKIRIAVVMNEDGSQWSAHGWSFSLPERLKRAHQRDHDEAMLNSCEESLRNAPRIRRIIEVEIPLPEELPCLQGILVPEE